MADYRTKVETGMVVLTPYAFARTAHHLFSMARDYQSEGDAYNARAYLFCAAIELALKAAILAEDCTPAGKESLKRLGHDLLKVHDHFGATFGKPLYRQPELDMLAKINAHYKTKGLEYFTMPVLVSTLRGRRDLPEIKELERAARKANVLLAKRKFCLDAKTSQPPSGGLLEFI